MSEKINAAHLQRAAYVYVRQSSSYQVRHHLEGQKRQYELGQRAEQLGFARVVVIDEDLGRSGSGLQERPGFGKLLTAVCQGEAGAVLALEASRLARNNRDWHHLVDLCALTDTLLIDDDGIYDPKVLNDRLLLGLKGTMSEFELGLMRQRARQAFLQKVRRGCAMWEVPVGYVRDEEGQLEKSPDRQVQQAISLVFETFQRLGSARQALIWFIEERILLPHARAGTQGREMSWRTASLSRVHQILRNPCYAGAFVYGRTATKMAIVEGRAHKGGGRSFKPMERWEVLIRDHHPGYISWQQYQKNRQLMSKNLAKRDGESGGAAQNGMALLSGLMRCGRCGRKMQVGYSGSHGDVGRYHCCGRRDHRGSGSCLSMGSLKIDAAIVEEMMQALEPVGIEAALHASQQMAEEEGQKRRALELALERARYEEQRARRQYDAVEPENRLVAAELEGRWNRSLAKQSELENRLAQLPEQNVLLTEDQSRRLKELSGDVRALWNHPQAPIPLKKRILRTLIEEIVVQRDTESSEHRLQVHWAGGVHTEVRVARNKIGMHRRMASADVVELVRELSKACNDQTIAGVLNRLGYKTGQGNSWRVSRVVSFRHTHGIEGWDGQKEWLTLEEVRQRLQASDTFVKGLISRGILPAKQVVPCAPWIIEEKALTTPAVQQAIKQKYKRGRVPSAPAQHPELLLK